MFAPEISSMRHRFVTDTRRALAVRSEIAAKNMQLAEAWRLLQSASPSDCVREKCRERRSATMYFSSNKLH
jgi:hypothetical protein